MSGTMLRLRVRRVSGDISTDDILPARYKHSSTDSRSFAPHVLEAHTPGFAATVRENDAIVGDGIFGIGSSREQAVTALIAAGVRAVVAPAFGTIFYRNAWNNCLPAITVDNVALGEGDTMTIDLAGGVICSGNRTCRFSAIPRQMLDMLASGGLLRHVQGNSHDR